MKNLNVNLIDFGVRVRKEVFIFAIFRLIKLDMVVIKDYLAKTLRIQGYYGCREK